MPRARHPDDYPRLAKRHKVIPRRDEPQPNGPDHPGTATSSNGPNPSEPDSIPVPNWRERYKSRHPKPSLHNARLAITAIGVACRNDLFHNKLLFGYQSDSFHHALHRLIGEISDHGIVRLRTILSDRFGFDLTEKHVRDAVTSLALEHCYDPVVDMLAEAEAAWDGEERLDRMAVDYFNTEDTPFNRAAMRKLMIAAVARVREPGCKFDTIPVLESEEGLGKSTALRLLAMSDDNFSDAAIIGKDSREVQENLASVWIHENAELGGMKKAEVEQVKNFASKRYDEARPAYGHYWKSQPRHSVEVGTTNADTYLQSQTGNRRFWPLKILARIDLDKLKRDRLQLWGEAAYWQSKGESLVLDEDLWTAAGEAQEERRVKDPWEDALANIPKVASVWNSELYQHENVQIIHVVGGQERVASEDLLAHVLKIPVGQQTRNDAMRLAEVMKTLNWERPPRNNKMAIPGKPKQVRGYFRRVPIPPEGEQLSF
ncbi:VapE domain-containing protein [Microvirga sp. RSM25]|uniref:VapE domain-containing protein n=1 Tax=Microvirga sp. RSM25 TaxID=3273802 RepID=UPI00384A8B84